MMVDIKTASTSQYSGCLLLNTSNTSVATTGNLQNKTGIISVDFTITTEGNYGILSKLFNGSWRIMLCTKAAFGVSSKFVPYRPNWDLVWEAINLVEITNEIEVKSGYTLVGRTHLYKQGKHIFGEIVIESTAGYTNPTMSYEIAVINNIAHVPKMQYTTSCGFGEGSEWNIKTIGYTFIAQYTASNPGTILVMDTGSTNQFVHIQVDYVTA